MHRFQFFPEVLDAHALVSCDVEVQLVIFVSEHEAACLMVGGDYDERLVGMLPVELVCHLHGVVHIYHLFYET